jgi:hypothetical protein
VLGLAVQGTAAVGAQLIVPLVSGSVNFVVGWNLDWGNSTFFVQGQGNVGVGLGAFVGWGGAVGPSWGDDPKTGLDSTNYAEVDAGWGPAGTIGATFDENGNLTGAGAGGPWKLGAGAGLGAFAGKQYTATYATPTLNEVWRSIFGDRKHRKKKKRSCP